MIRLRRDAVRIADHFGLTFTALEAESTRVKRRYGSCHSDGRIKIRLTHARTGRPLKYSSMIDTLCHELAHLKHFNHGPRFKSYYQRILEWARAEGIYCPGRPARWTPPPPHLWQEVEALAERLRDVGPAPSIAGRPPESGGASPTGARTPPRQRPRPAPPPSVRPEQLGLFGAGADGARLT